MHSLQGPSRSASFQLFLVFVPIIAAYIILARFLTYAPLIDDYWHLIAFALKFHSAPTLASRLVLLFTEQVGPYKLIFDHMLIILQLSVFGKLNFPVLIFLGNLTPLGIFALYWKNTRQDGLRQYGVLALLPISLLVFSLNYAETLDWAVSGLQQPAVILFSLAAIHFLVRSDRGTKTFAAAYVFGVLASLTYANGVLVWLVGLVYLVLSERKTKNFFPRLLVWCSCFAVMLFTYLYHYHGGVAAHAPLWQQFIFLLSFCGGGFENMHHFPVPYSSIPVGAVVLAVVLHAVFTRYDKKNPYSFYAMLWVMVTAVVVANARVGMGLQLSLSSRYKIYCDLLLVFCYLYGLDTFSSSARGQRKLRTYLACAITTSLLINVGSDVAGAVFLRTRKQRAETAMRAYLAAPASASPMFLVEDVLSPAEMQSEDTARKEMNEAIAQGIYTPPAM